MKNDDFFEELKNLNFDTAEPTSGHEDRFHTKLKQYQPKTNKVKVLWFSLGGVAAALLIGLLVMGTSFNSFSFYKEGDLASVSPEMKKTQNFYSNLIEQELKSIEDKRTPATSQIINDALVQMQTLEKEYDKLKKDLLKSGKDKRVIFAMINNFQQRIDLLKQVLEQTQRINELKIYKNETNTL
ncbi:MULTISPECIES: DUF4179 domain-containing protein [Mesonia]|uniref:Uncharacterized protein n=1 Tax=Mesonia oceanica TaxID=2687242 RepID=A0AC61Y736_9FLAO|nr:MULTISPECIES: DUF4179 domain-containing protein [Mesonia]MAN28880.1 hypothetical protein [Mesonia sp.]MAQ40373.1 hypothetical protein [Mesonia sp.]MBJ97994.1 hypothetical protein [Flavobacteriaceae bacterium]VVV00210.1 hypothetical protein FVB9532_01475 [Mesonia oceanica]|tara:strand:+ start:327 stop:878 length:552 start_codon:yes stop_codon:yes gene_type:complete